MEKSRKNHSESLVSSGKERCANPWNGECISTDIVLYALYKGDRLPICRACWNEIADSDFEWGADHVFQPW